jgi:hypothetical protein
VHGGPPTRGPPTCRRATRGLPARFALATDLGGGTPSCDVGPDARGRFPLQGSESNRRGPTYEAGLGASTRPAKNNFEHAAGIEPASAAWKAGAYADRPRVRCERPAGVEPAPPNWQAGVQPGTPWARWSSGPDSNRHEDGFADRRLSLQSTGALRRREESNLRDRGPPV